MGIEIELRECEECKTQFQPTRVKQRFCCKKCSSRRYTKDKAEEKKKLKSTKKKPKEIPAEYLVRGTISYRGYKHASS